MSSLYYFFVRAYEFIEAYRELDGAVFFGDWIHLLPVLRYNKAAALIANSFVYEWKQQEAVIEKNGWPSSAKKNFFDTVA